MKVGIIGGGASGVIASLKLKKNNPNIDVILFEQNDRVLKKLLKTGNGKCNIYNSNISKEFYNDFSLFDTSINLKQELLELGILTKELEYGRCYPYSESSKSVVSILVNDLNKYNVNVICNYNVTSISKKNNLFVINNEYSFDYLIVATGSCAQEHTNGYELLESLHHHVTGLRPGLVPIITYEKTSNLENLRVKCSASCNGYILDGEILFKSNGLSGILSLDLSRIASINDIISLDLMPEYSRNDILNLFNNSNSLYENLLMIFNKPLAEEVIKRGNNELTNVIDIIKNFTFTVKSFRSFNDSQITIGGVFTSEVDNNFESNIVNKLYICGEVLDVDGACGGYNLSFAFMSGIKASLNILKNNDK